MGFGVTMSDKVAKSVVVARDLDQILFLGRNTPNEASRMLDNFWFEQRAEPELQNSNRKAGDLKKETTMVPDITNCIKPQRLQTGNLLFLVHNLV